MLRKVIIDRSTLLPYIYTNLKKSFDSGLLFPYPLYYDYPEEDLAYKVLTIDGSFS